MNIKVLISLLLIIGLYPLLAQDHKENLSGPYDNFQQIIEECLMCHDDSGDEVLQSNHWNWLSSNLSAVMEPGIINGKHIPINNFCIAVPGNNTQCTTCHLPLSGNDETFDFNVAENIDCLVCHEQTGTYSKLKFESAKGDSAIDLLAIAQSVGKPTDANCGSCHFSGIGGVMMKSGAMDKSLFEPTEENDFHLGGLGFGCSDCHESKSHNISARNEASESPVTCENCHDSAPHEKELLNQHYTAVACQTCHIPTYSRTEPSIVRWDWSKAGDDIESVKDEFGEETFLKTAGEIVWAKNIKPEYYWSNSTSNYYELGEKIEKNKIVDLNKPAGKISDLISKISPYKVVKVNQPFDPVNKNLIIPRIFGEQGYTSTFDWVSASSEGMKVVNLEFSGTVDFIETKMYWPINHFVMSADNTLKCTSCHGKGGEKLLNWKELGYPDDPMKKGGRVKNKLVRE
ncbi:MAG: tetrathionate reductase family octaheme c-type cytochrome [Ignavibacteriaceae bacterium]|nr:tetrathionate reductase family octaheme c-type cytochrome [Ignavibacteriaceae bacterium]